MATLKLKIGDDNTIRFTITDADDAAVNLTGGTIKLKIAKTLSITDANAEYYGEYTTFTDATNGIHDETIPDSTSGSWTAGWYKYQTRFIDSSNIVISEDVGKAELETNLIDNE